jgi:hypothetical protein
MVSVWLNADSLQSTSFIDDYVIAKKGSFSLLIESTNGVSGTPVARIINNSSTAFEAASSETISVGSFYHILFGMIDGEVFIYINGVETGVNSSFTGTLGSDALEGLFLAVSGEGETPVFDGSIDEASVWGDTGSSLESIDKSDLDALANALYADGIGSHLDDGTLIWTPCP